MKPNSPQRSGKRDDKRTGKRGGTSRGSNPGGSPKSKSSFKPKRDDSSSPNPHKPKRTTPGYAYDEAEDAAYAKRKQAEAGREATTYERSKLHCPVAKRCGGCEWLAMPYDVQLKRKQAYIEELFAGYHCPVDPIVGMENPVGYRNKVQLPLAAGYPDRDGNMTVRWGIFERGTHSIVPCDSCLVEDKRARPIIATVAKLMEELHIKPYDEKTGSGALRYALVRTANATNEIMLTLVCTSPRIPSQRPFIDKLLEKHPEITTIVLNVNRERTSVILGSEEKVLVGPGYIEDELCGCRFRISSSSFYQTNPRAAENLYNLAIEMADLKSSDLIGDAYCGTGTIGIVAAKKSGAELLGVERNGDAVIDARENAELNDVTNAEFITGDAGSVYARMARAGEKLDVVFMDPPRAGSSQAFLANLSRLGPRRVIYISCEPKSQVRDLQALTKNGYQVKRIAPVDMFPHTDHVENIVLLERPPRGTYSGRRSGSDDGKRSNPYNHQYDKNGRRMYFGKRRKKKKAE